MIRFKPYIAQDYIQAEIYSVLLIVGVIDNVRPLVREIHLSVGHTNGGV